MTPFRAGIVAVIIVVVASYFAYTQANPFADAYEFSATFNTANNLQPDAPVRIAGVDVGVVKEVKPVEDGSDAAQVTMEMKEEGLPLHTDAELKIRPRIFLEGNEFVDVEPGTPSAPELEEGETIPVNQTATPVQFGEVLTALQSDTREDLRTFLSEYGLKAVQGEGARGFNEAIKFWEPAYKNSAIANEALHGTEEGDLGRVLRGQQKTFEALSSSPDDLRGLVTNFNITAAAFAREDDALQATVPALRDVLAVGRPALQALNNTLPGVNRFAVDALPGVRSSGPTIEASFPFVRQTRLLFSQAELRGLVDDLRPTIPALARVNRRTIPLLNQNRALSRCQNRVILPFARDTDWQEAPGPTDQEQSGEPPFKQAPRSLVGLAGESRIHDGASPLFRLLALGGARTIINNSESEGLIAGFTPFSPEGVQPTPPTRGDGELDVPEHRPDVPCENQEPPDLNAPSATGVGDFDVTELLDLLPKEAQSEADLQNEQKLQNSIEELEKLQDASPAEQRRFQKELVSDGAAGAGDSGGGNGDGGKSGGGNGDGGKSGGGNGGGGQSGGDGGGGESGGNGGGGK